VTIYNDVSIVSKRLHLMPRHITNNDPQSFVLTCLINRFQIHSFLTWLMLWRQIIIIIIMQSNSFFQFN